MAAVSSGVYGSEVSWTRAAISSLPGIGLIAIFVNSCDDTAAKMSQAMEEYKTARGNGAGPLPNYAAAKVNKYQVGCDVNRKKFVDYSAFAISCTLTAIALGILAYLGYIKGQYIYLAVLPPTGGAIIGSLGVLCARGYLQKNEAMLRDLNEGREH